MREVLFASKTEKIGEGEYNFIYDTKAYFHIWKEVNGIAYGLLEFDDGKTEWIENYRFTFTTFGE